MRFSCNLPPARSSLTGRLELALASAVIADQLGLGAVSVTDHTFRSSTGTRGTNRMTLCGVVIRGGEMPVRRLASDTAMFRDLAAREERTESLDVCFVRSGRSRTWLQDEQRAAEELANPG